MNQDKQSEVIEAWQSIETAPFHERILLAWDDHPDISPHVEIGRRSGEDEWANTYGKAFSGTPTHWAPLPLLPSQIASRPSPSTPSEGVIELCRALDLFARLEVPAKREGNAGFYSIPFERIERAREALARLSPLPLVEDKS